MSIYGKTRECRQTGPLRPRQNCGCAAIGSDCRLPGQLAKTQESSFGNLKNSAESEHSVNQSH
jgi:hypothetical protein